jgi:hypothetical protein
MLRSQRANKERIEREIKVILEMEKSYQIEHDRDSPELAIELHYELGFSYTAIIKSKIVSENTMDKANKSFRNRRPIGQVGGRNILNRLEFLVLKDWIEEKIALHEQPKAFEIEDQVCLILVSKLRFIFHTGYGNNGKNSIQSGKYIVQRVGLFFHKIQQEV